MKRKHSDIEQNKRVSFHNSVNDINYDFITECQEEFDRNPINAISRNAIVSIGSTLSTINSKHLNNIDHVFLNTIKKKNLKATDQGRSGRCWMFSGLNMFRHSVINALDLENFEFSETHLFFWDKLERANVYLSWFIENPNVKYEDESFKFIIDDYTSDGGWWNMFSNIVLKYGLIPKSAMKETFQSEDTDDMNQILNNCLQACANHIHNNKNKPLSYKTNVKNKTLKQIYSTLVKFLGEPPKTFKWSYTNDEDESCIIPDLEPSQFMNIIMPDIVLTDFVVLTHLPGKLSEKQMYEVNYTTNIKEGQNFKFLNLSMPELVKYTSKSILSGMPVWFAADISKNFNPYHSTLDDKLTDETKVFGENHHFNKADKITFHNLSANHAMTIVGVNINNNNKPESWQVENSWGYWDNEIPGNDGFLYMSQSWFEENIMQVVIHKNYLSRSLQKLISQNPILLNPWDCVAPALKIKPVKPPKVYSKFKQKNYT